VIVAGVLLIRRVRWRLQRAPRVFVSQDGRRGRT
jgi:hypothetical protein